jgi:hypothetical protein
MLNQAQKRLIVLLACVVAWCLVESALSPSQQQEKYNYSTKNTEKKAADISTGERLAAYTLWLAIFTGLLVVISGVQGYFLLRADKTARITANAAKLSAEAAIGVELPKLFVKKIELIRVEPTFGTVEITITNYGRTPAFVFWESAEYRVGELPREPDYFNGVDMEPGTVIHNGGEYKMTARERDMTAVFPRAPFNNGQQTLWTYGIIYYLDFLDKPHPFRFCAQLFSVIAEGETRILRFIQGGPEVYTKNA